MKISFALLLLLITAVPSIANKGDVVIGDNVVMRFRSEAGGISAEHRANVVTDRIRPLLGLDQFFPEKLVVNKNGYENVILYDGALIATVDAATAAANNTGPEDLSKIWRINLAKSIELFKANEPEH